MAGYRSAREFAKLLGYSDIAALLDETLTEEKNGGTALYDTVVTAADKMERFATRPRKVLIVITDGDDNASKLTLDNAIHRVQDMQGPIIYSIGLMFGGSESRHARRDLRALRVKQEESPFSRAH